MALGIQVFGLVFSAFIVYVSFLYYKRKEFTFAEWGFWLVFAASFGAVSLFPDLLNPIVRTLNLGRKLDLFIILGFMFLIAMVFYTYHITRHTQRKVEEAVRKFAIDEQMKKEK
jgi:hypothetical protein